MKPGFIFVVFLIVEEEDSWRSGDGRRGILRGLIKSVTEYASTEESDSRERFVILNESGWMKFKDRRLPPTLRNHVLRLSKVLCDSLGLDIKLPGGNDRMLSPTKSSSLPFCSPNSKNSFPRHVMPSVLLETNQRRK